jgi:Asp/Glu/hydantoin racemase
MSKRLAFIHTVTSLVGAFDDLCAELIPDADVFHIADNSLIQNVIRDGEMSVSTARRLVRHMISAEEAGADIVMVTCSSVGESVPMGQPILRVPVYRVDRAMADKAVGLGQRIGVAATLSTTLDPTARLIGARADAQGKDVNIVARLCQGAFDAVVSGDTETHDAIVSKGLRTLMDEVDVVVLAQASMARVVETLPEADRKVPILSSPRLAVEFLAEVMGAM